MTTGAIAVGTLILKKAFEKTGDKLGEAVSHQVGNLLNLRTLKRRLPAPDLRNKRSKHHKKPE